MKNVMVDIETLDTRPSAAILSIAAVRFDLDTGQLGPTFHKYVDVDSNMQHGRTVSGATILWWLSQPDEARHRIAGAAAEPLQDVLKDFSIFIEEGDLIWGNGAGFDNVILEDAYRAVGLNAPWRFWSNMCYRTLKSMFRNAPKPQFEGVAHDALDDAKFQARHLVSILNYNQKQSITA